MGTLMQGRSTTDISDQTGRGRVEEIKSTDGAEHVDVKNIVLLSGEDVTNDVVDVESKFSYRYSTAAATLDLSQNAGAFLHSITILNAALTGTIIAYDETTGASTTIIAAFPAGALGGTYTFDAECTKGLQVVSNNAADDYTVSYRPSTLD